MGAEKTEMVQKFFVGLCFFVATSGNVGGHKKSTDLRNCSRFSKHCTKPAFEDEMCPRRTT